MKIKDNSALCCSVSIIIREGLQCFRKQHLRQSLLIMRISPPSLSSCSLHFQLQRQPDSCSITLSSLFVLTLLPVIHFIEDPPSRPLQLPEKKKALHSRSMIHLLTLLSQRALLQRALLLSALLLSAQQHLPFQPLFGLEEGDTRLALALAA